MDKKIIAESSSDSNVIIFFAGHGCFRNNKGYWVPNDTKNLATSEFISFTSIMKFFKDAKIHHLLIISDSCFAGSIFRRNRCILDNDELKVDRFKSRWALTAGGKEEVSDGGRKGSPFSSILCNVLEKSSQLEKYVTITEIHSMIIREFPKNEKQTPVARPLNITNFEEIRGQFVFTSKFSPVISTQKPELSLSKPPNSGYKQPEIFYEPEEGRYRGNYQPTLYTGSTFFSNNIDSILVIVLLCLISWSFDKQTILSFNSNNTQQNIIYVPSIIEDRPKPDYDGLQQSLEGYSHNERRIIKPMENYDFDNQDETPMDSQNLGHNYSYTKSPTVVDLLLVGSFKNKDNALSLMQKLKAFGFNKSEIVMKENSPNLIIITDFNLKQKKIKSELQDLKKRGIDVYYAQKKSSEIYRKVENK